MARRAAPDVASASNDAERQTSAQSAAEDADAEAADVLPAAGAAVVRGATRAAPARVADRPTWAT